jgi:hypothetical protein
MFPAPQNDANPIRKGGNTNSKKPTRRAPSVRVGIPNDANPIPKVDDSNLKQQLYRKQGSKPKASLQI